MLAIGRSAEKLDEPCAQLSDVGPVVLDLAGNDDVSPTTLASLVLTTLEVPDDAHLMEIALRAAPSGGAR